MKRVLIITYYWPPSGGSGVQRWLKMSKYLPEYGWQPVIYTPENAEYPVEDPSLLQDVAPETEVIKRKIVEPYSFYKRLLGIKKEQKVKVGFINEGERKQGWKENLSLWVRGNLFIPDARCWWVKPSVRFLKNYLKEHPVDAMISTGPPHSMHLIALQLRKALNIPWIADFRDPWTEIDFYQDLKLTRWGDKKHHRLEKQVLSNADKVVTIGWDAAKGLEALGAHSVQTITNGFDEEPTNGMIITPSEKFTISHIGALGASRNAIHFWEALGDMAKNGSQFRNDLSIRLIGQVDVSAIQTIKANGIMDNTELITYIPHEEINKMQMESQVLLLLINNTPNAKGILTGKLFEYLSSCRPILCIGPEDGDAAHIINEAKAGVTVGFDDMEKMKTVIKGLYDKYNSGTLKGCPNEAIEKYSRKALAGEFVEMMNNLKNERPK